MMQPKRKVTYSFSDNFFSKNFIAKSRSFFCSFASSGVIGNDFRSIGSESSPEKSFTSWALINIW
jgi:hypothetical protein